MPFAHVSVVDLSVLDRAAAASALDASLGENGVVFVRMTEAHRAATLRSVRALVLTPFPRLAR